MKRKNLLAWQYSGYSHYHQNRLNLWLHVLTVPLFWAGTFTIIAAIFANDLSLFMIGVGLPMTSLVVQGVGHKREKNPSEPFLSPADFVFRFFAEQFITFPRWMIFGRTKRQP